MAEIKTGDYFAEQWNEPDEDGILLYNVYKAVDSEPDEHGEVVQHRIFIAGSLTMDQAEALVEAHNG